MKRTAKLYRSLSARLTGRNAQRRKLANNTYLERLGVSSGIPDAAPLAIALHGSYIVKIWPNGAVTLNLSGWNTVTTRERVNAFLSEHADAMSATFRVWTTSGTAQLMRRDPEREETRTRRVYVYAFANGDTLEGPHGSRPQWRRAPVDPANPDAPRGYEQSARGKFLRSELETYRPGWTLAATLPDRGPVTIGPRGAIHGAATPAALQERDATRKACRDYAALVASALPLPLPGPGDCFGCQLFEQDTRPGKLSEHANADHIREHFRERYLVPSLVANALTFAGCSPNGIGSAYFWGAFAYPGLSLDAQSAATRLATDNVRKFVFNYCAQVLGVRST
jgi:hypothetical protein